MTRFVGTVLASLALLGCAASPRPFDPAVDALKVCLVGESQAGWAYLPVVPSNAVEMRDAISTSKVGPRPIPNETEYWFQHADGRIMRCTFAGVGFLSRRHTSDMRCLDAHATLRSGHLVRRAGSTCPVFSSVIDA